MVEHDRDRSRHEQILEAFNNGEPGVQLDMPAATLDTVDRGLEALPGDRGIGHSCGFEIDPYPSNTCAHHLVEHGLRCLVIDDGDTARPASEFWIASKVYALSVP